MALLEEVLDRPHDPGYQTAASQREARGLPASTGSRTALLLIAALLLGFLLAVAAHTLRAPDPAAAGTREALIARIQSQEQLGDAHATSIESLRQDVRTLESKALDDTDSGDGQEIAQAGIEAGAVPMTGPGVTVTLDDQPADGAEAGATPNRVLSSDLQLVVNGLWERGAEAISINDQRLTSTSSIRFAGVAIVVDFRGLTRPYVVTAIGDPEALSAELDTGATGVYLKSISDEYGILSQVGSAADLTVPAASRLTTRVAEVVPPPTSTSSSTSSSPDSPTAPAGPAPSTTPQEESP